MHALALNPRFTRVILVAFVSHAGSEHVHTREEDLAGRCWHDLSWRHEQPLRFICSRVPVSDTGLTAPGHCHPHGLCRLRCCKGTAAGRGQAPGPETPSAPPGSLSIVNFSISYLLPLLSSAFLFLFFEATAIPGSWGLSTGTALWPGQPAAKPQFRSSELAVITKEGGRLSKLCREAQGHAWAIRAVAGCES